MRKLVFILSIFFLSIGAIVAFFLQQPSETPRNVTLSNVTESRTTISWTTQAAVYQRVVIKTSLGDFSAIPLAALEHNYSNGISKLHYVDIKDLKPNTIYYFKIYQNLDEVYQGRFKTAEVLGSISQPHPVYGRVLGPDRKTPLKGAMIYLRAFVPQQASSSSTLLSTLTNSDGRWTLDLSALRKATLKEAYQLVPQLLEEVVVDAGALGRVKATTTLNRDEPWPDIFLVPIKPKVASTSAQRK